MVQVVTTRAVGITDTVQYGYDGNVPGTTQTVSGQKGLLTAMKDGNGRLTLYSYDNFNQVSGRQFVNDTTFNVTGSGTYSTSESYTYNETRNLATHTDRNGNLTTYAYSATGMLQTVHYASGTDTTYTYYPDSAVKTMGDATGTTTYVYDAVRNQTGLQRPAPIGNVSYEYDVADRLKKTTSATGDILYTYDSADNPKTVKSPALQTTTYNYDELDRVTSVAHFNGLTTEYAYDSNNRAISIQMKDASANVQLSHVYVYDLGGNVTQRIDAQGNTLPVLFTYVYDGRDQLTGETAQQVLTPVARGNPPATGNTPLYSHAYTYDHNENRLSKTVTLGTGSPTTETYAYYPNSDRLKQIGNVGYNYDANGNLTGVVNTATTPSTSLNAISWSKDNRLTSFTNAAGTTGYGYNGLGLRASKTSGGTTKSFLTNGDLPASALLSDGSATYVPGVSETRGSVTSGLHFDGLGSVRATSSASGGVGEFALFDGFGNPFLTTDWAGQTTAGRPLGFVGGEGYQGDAESGLQLLGNRYYSLQLGRFLSSDPAEAGTNWYAYCENNPTGFVDPEGLQGKGKGKKKGQTPPTVTPGQGTKKPGNGKPGTGKGGNKPNPKPRLPFPKGWPHEVHAIAGVSLQVISVGLQGSWDMKDQWNYLTPAQQNYYKDHWGEFLAYVAQWASDAMKQK